MNYLIRKKPVGSKQCKVYVTDLFCDLGGKFFLFTGCDNAHLLILNSEDVSDACKRVKTGPQRSRIFLQFVSEILFKKKRNRNIFVKGWWPAITNAHKAVMNRTTKTTASRPWMMEFMEKEHLWHWQGPAWGHWIGDSEFVPESCVHYLIGLVKMFHWDVERKTWQRWDH